MRLKRIKSQMLLLTSLQATQALCRNVDVKEALKNRQTNVFNVYTAKNET